MIARWHAVQHPWQPDLCCHAGTGLSCQLQLPGNESGKVLPCSRDHGVHGFAALSQAGKGPCSVCDGCVRIIRCGAVPREDMPNQHSQDIIWEHHAARFVPQAVLVVHGSHVRGCAGLRRTLAASSACSTNQLRALEVKVVAGQTTAGMPTVLNTKLCHPPPLQSCALPEDGTQGLLARPLGVQLHRGRTYTVSIHLVAAGAEQRHQDTTFVRLYELLGLAESLLRQPR